MVYSKAKIANVTLIAGSVINRSIRITGMNPRASPGQKLRNMLLGIIPPPSVPHLRDSTKRFAALRLQKASLTNKRKN